MYALLSEQMLVLFAILALGSLIGQLSWRGLSLGTAAVFFVGLAFGHFGYTVPKPIMDLGLLLFLYAIGLQAGPRFFRTFRKQGWQFVVIAGASLLAAAGVTVILARLLDLPFALAAGMFTGAVTNTPSLAGAIDTVARIEPLQTAAVSVGYGIAYPFSIIGVTLLVQFMPKLLRRDVKTAEEQWQAQQLRESPALQKKQFCVSNPNLDGKRLGDLDTHRLSQVNISRVRQGDQVVAATPEIVLHTGDVLLAVGTEEELNKLRLLIGEECDVAMETNTRAVSRDMTMTDKTLAGKRLMDLHVWERYNVIITRIRRQGLEITPLGTSTLEMGDTLRVVGDQVSIDQFAEVIGGDTRQVDETNMVPFLIGLVLGIALGLIPFRLPNGMTIKLGAAGGAFLVSLILGHFGRVGPFRVYVPAAARNLLSGARVDALSGRRRRQCGHAARQSRGRARLGDFRRRRADHGGRRHDHAPAHDRGLPDEHPIHHGLDRGCDDQSAGSRRRQHAHHHRRARGDLRQRVSGGVDLQDSAGAVVGADPPHPLMRAQRRRFQAGRIAGSAGLRTQIPTPRDRRRRVPQLAPVPGLIRSRARPSA